MAKYMRSTPIHRRRFSMSCGTNSPSRPQIWMRPWAVRRLYGACGRAGDVFLHPADRRPRSARKITTLEGLLEDGKPNKVQQAFIDEQAAQCGYCISGMVMRAQALLLANPHPTDDEIRKRMQPNLCRCGTHAAIMRAVKRAAAA